MTHSVLPDEKFDVIASTAKSRQAYISDVAEKLHQQMKQIPVCTRPNTFHPERKWWTEENVHALLISTNREYDLLLSSLAAICRGKQSLDPEHAHALLFCIVENAAVTGAEFKMRLNRVKVRQGSVHAGCLLYRSVVTGCRCPCGVIEEQCSRSYSTCDGGRRQRC